VKDVGPEKDLMKAGVRQKNGDQMSIPQWFVVMFAKSVKKRMLGVQLLFRKGDSAEAIVEMRKKGQEEEREERKQQQQKRRREHSEREQQMGNEGQADEGTMNALQKIQWGH